MIRIGLSRLSDGQKVRAMSLADSGPSKLTSIAYRLKGLHSSGGTPNLTIKRWSGHNTMNIEPSNFGWKHTKNMMHFYITISIVPISVITTILNIRANPELSEVPDGYEPRHWEYYKHPITRFMARYMFTPMELEHEMKMSYLESISQAVLVRNLQRKVEKTMRFHNDHRSLYFKPFFAEYFRSGRDDHMLGEPAAIAAEGRFYDHAYDPNINPVPTEGYRPE